MKIHFLLSPLWAASSEGRGCEYFEAMGTKSVSLVLLRIFMQGLYTQPPHAKAPRVLDFASHPRDFHLSLVLVKGRVPQLIDGTWRQDFQYFHKLCWKVGRRTAEAYRWLQLC